jgi:peptidoglycan/LPS O-acetylase OafA/YrhL
VVFAILLLLLPVVLAIAWLLFVTVERWSIQPTSPRLAAAQPRATEDAGIPLREDSSHRSYSVSRRP